MLVNLRLRSLTLVVGCLAAGTVSAQPGGWSSAESPVAIVGDSIISWADLETAAASRLRRLRNEEYQIRRRVLDELITRALVGGEMGLNLDADRALGTTTAGQPEGSRSDAGTSAGPRMLDSRQTRNERLLREVERRKAVVEELRKRTRVLVFLAPPRTDIDTTGARSIGPGSAAVEIVEFGDYQCPYSAKVFETLQQIRAKYPESVRWVAYDFPLLEIHADAAAAAEAAACAGEQDRFWEMREVLFRRQRALGVEDLKRYAGELALDVGRFGECIGSRRQSAKWVRDVELGRGIGVAATPTLFLNGRVVDSAIVAEQVEIAVQGARGRRSDDATASRRR